MSSYIRNRLISPSNDESDHTLKHRTRTRPLSSPSSTSSSFIINNHSMRNQSQQQQQQQVPNSRSISTSASFPPPQRHQHHHQQQLLPLPNISHRTMQKLNDPSYIHQLHNMALERVDHAWQRISASSSSLPLSSSSSPIHHITTNHTNQTNITNQQVLPHDSSNTTSYFDTTIDHYPTDPNYYSDRNINNHGSSSLVLENGSGGGNKNHKNHNTITGHHSISSVEDSCTIHSDGIVMNQNSGRGSTEMATLRGTKRALRESNEIQQQQHQSNHYNYGITNPDFDLDTLEGTVDTTSGTIRTTQNPFRRVLRTILRHGNPNNHYTGSDIGRNGPEQRVVRFQSLTNHHNHHNNPSTSRTSIPAMGRMNRQTMTTPATSYHPMTTNTNTNDVITTHNNNNNEEEEFAWMCGVCGMIFANELIADQHEQQHMINVVMGMEWNQQPNNNIKNMNQNKNMNNNNNNNTNIKTMTTLMKATLGNTTRNTTNHEQQQQQPMMSPPPTTTTTTAVGTTRATTIMVENLPNNPLLLKNEQRQRRMRRGRRNDAISYDTTGNIPVGNDDDDDDPAVPPNTFHTVIIDSNISSPIQHDTVRLTDNDNNNNINNNNNNDHTIKKNRSEQHQHARFEDEYPGIDADLPLPSVQQQQRPRMNIRFAADYDNMNYIEHHISSGVNAATNGHHHQQQQQQHQPQQHEVNALYLHTKMNDRDVLADEALFDVTSRAVSMILTRTEVDAEYELSLLARDKVYYDECTKRAILRRANPSNRFRSDREDMLAKVQNKFVDAYQLMKESDGKKGITDQYNRMNKKGGKEGTTSLLMKHNDTTLYVNVMVKNSVEVVRHELERLAKQRWDVSTSQQDDNLTRFERFRVYTQRNIVKLAGIALASDFTPRRIAVQLSNDLYRLLTPKLKRRGVTIETEIEYRVGPYFVLAVNIKTIDWWKLIKSTHKDSVQRQLRWEKDRRSDKESANRTEVSKKVSFFRSNFDYFQGAFNLSVFDVIERAIALLYYIHWTIYLPICWVSYYVLLGPSLRHFVITTVADEIFSYVEEKGMEMEIRVCRTETQAAFMLSALRELRVDGQELKKKIEQSESREKGLVLGPLMGPAIAADKGPAPPIPAGFEIPENLEYIGLELNLPVGFQRIRWAMLSKRSTFVVEALYKTEARYENIVMGEWSKFPDQIGEPKLPDTISPNDFIGAELEGEYLMPKSAFVSANMCYETHYILAYNEYCFCLKKLARNPDAPFGKTFLAWTQYLVINTGNDTCKITCSVQPEFPHGTPMVSRQITSGMRAGTGELFVLIGSTIEKYSDEFP